MEDVVVMFRPVGPAELDLVAESGYRRWPPRLPGQPIFYPVTNEKYATEIARWNVRQFGAGAVTRFSVKREFMDQFQIQTVGAKHASEWWIPAARLEEFNENIVGTIEVVQELTESPLDRRARVFMEFGDSMITGA